MIVTMHQPEHLPWLGFFHKMAAADLYVYLDTVQYRHRYFQNRNHIIGTQGPVWTNVPVMRRGQSEAAINEVCIDNSRDWRHSYWGSIVYSYGRHPYFKQYAGQVEAIIRAPRESLVTLNYQLIDFFRAALEIQTPLVRASAYHTPGQKTELLHALSLQVGATTYLSGPSGRDYLDEARFQASGMSVVYHDFKHPTYSQAGRRDFTPYLSTLDLLMNHGPQSRDILFAEAATPVLTAIAS